MEMQSKIMARGDGDRLSDLPDAILLHILSMLWNPKEVVRSSVLSKRWQFLWKSVPISLDFETSFGYSEKGIRDFVGSVNRELHYWRSFEKIRKFRVSLYTYKKSYIKDIDLWIHFATKVANVEDFTLEIRFGGDLYEFPQFAYKNTSLRNLDLRGCNLSPPGSVNWSRLVSLSLGDLELTDGIMGEVLSGCPNLECLELDSVSGIHRLEISSVKLRELSIREYLNELEILAPYIQTLQILGICPDINLQQRNAASLVTAVLYLTAHFEDGEDDLEEECSYFKELLHSVAHVENLELGPWCIQCLSILELKGWQSQPSSRKSLKLNVALDQMDFPGICSFLQSSADLETLVVDWYSHEPRDLLSEYTNEVEQSRRFETHNFNCSSLHLKTIKFINFDGPLSGNKSVLPFVKYLLKNAIVLEKFVITCRFIRSDVSRDYVKMKQEFLSFPRSSPHASIVFSYR
ncbi:F-box protein At5g03100-like [Nicotiana tabacum]|uniref:F-box/LRR-repeat protein At3g03360-like n=4 Tax=Nicotiana tabacum TaxID=4097 RepID=A0A1S3XYY1_TOBAC|nr:PREDICTED: F-box/LRR-repeat protein At3g03360-like [Nicotiana tabacum]XP_016444915.1 PREDICTED: F-box/LRR-repeat protein At3g03360-like [Nicotiana tabacum]XP_016444916.1 PREDICTED: F-box/LRR-repeat protein At3g03360-like [Nicotiana tabacum]XP_016444917.1 PREDICTED: F-box/LRR-repeat protein At3g03360-like [Nicotiana tabacum]XP_018629761.1 F-box/LRR-repeat protein At3g03360-like [Nicotiana tomentosiformis]XP_033514617.1 F-box/LRR-repeat protein At3g03360-like [Nicotiana tomentosiformis]XP_03